jgi:hypothetical protein
MMKKQIVYAFAWSLLILSAACEHIHEPWVPGRDQLKQERSRPDQAQMELRHRLLEVQTDR